MEKSTSSANSLTDKSSVYHDSNIGEEPETLFQGTNISSTVKQHGLLEFPVKGKFDKIV
jgi:hypothetical protein